MPWLRNLTLSSLKGHSALEEREDLCSRSPVYLIKALGPCGREKERIYALVALYI